jgi:ferredoxin-NADP reductase
VADIDALLYLPGHTRQQLQRALRIPALAKGWQGSFQAMLQQDLSPKTAAGNPGLADEEQPPAWPGFRPMRVATINKESDSVTSLILEPSDEQPLPVFQAGQFVVLRLRLDPAKPPVLRSYSLSDLPAADHLRISVKTELNGIGSSFLCSRTQPGDLLDVSAPRGTFTLRPGQSPVVLLSAGVGATPVMAMLHALAAERSQREIWWVYGARNRVEHPFAEESRSLLKQLPHGRGCIVYSRPAATDQVGADFDAPGHIDIALIERIGVPRNSAFFLCGPSSFLQNMRDGLRTWGALAENVHTEVFGSLEAITPGLTQVTRTPHLPEGRHRPRRHLPRLRVARSHERTARKLSEIQGDDPLILTLARGNYCPKEHQQHLELAANYPKIAVAYTKSPRSRPTPITPARSSARRPAPSGRSSRTPSGPSRRTSTSRSTPTPSTTR